MPNAWDSGKTTGGGGGGSGTVTDVSVASANGVSGTVANSTTTPEITLSLGNITPSNVLISGQTASRCAIFDASKNVIAADTATYPSLTEFSYVKGGTSSFQTQINKRQQGYTAPVQWYDFNSLAQTYTAQLPHYYAIPITQDGLINELEIQCGTFTSNADFELGVYNYTYSGNVTKITSGTVTVTSTGFFRATMASPAAVTKSAGRVILALLQLNGTVALYSHTGYAGSISVERLFKGATLQSSLPATETTRSSISFAPYLQPY